MGYLRYAIIGAFIGEVIGALLGIYIGAMPYHGWLEISSISVKNAIVEGAIIMACVGAVFGIVGETLARCNVDETASGKIPSDRFRQFVAMMLGVIDGLAVGWVIGSSIDVAIALTNPERLGGWMKSLAIMIGPVIGLIYWASGRAGIEAIGRQIRVIMGGLISGVFVAIFSVVMETVLRLLLPISFPGPYTTILARVASVPPIWLFYLIPCGITIAVIGNVIIGGRAQPATALTPH